MKNASCFGHANPCSSPIISFLVIFLLISISSLPLRGQMVSVVNSSADDIQAHPFDNPNTQDVDESLDGFCGDSLGRCTLRAALEEASSLGLGAYVTFTGEFSIPLHMDNGPFYVSDNSRIQGNGRVLISSSAANAELMIIQNNTMVQGIDFYFGRHGLTVGGDNNLIGGSEAGDKNSFLGNSEVGLGIYGNNNVIKGNYVGLDRDNSDGIENQIGIQVYGGNNTIGGLTPGERNFISGNNIGLSVITSEGNTFITGNYIGTDTSSSEARPNRVGIEILGPNTTVGGITVQERNVISGNSESGVLVGIQASDNAILGNHIGVDISGVEVVPNRDGIILGPGSINTLVQGNEIISNTNAGILINGLPFVASEHHKIRGNTIEYNDLAGIAIQGNAVRNIIGSSLSQDSDPNTIQFNGLAGVVNLIQLGTPTENTIRKNAFRDNGILGIDNCATCQDAILSPVVMSYTDLGLGVATITGTHPIHSSVIDVYKGEVNSSGVYEGMLWIGSGVVDGSGNFLVTADPCDCDTIVATATNPDGSTSKFSDGFAAMTTAVEVVDKNLNTVIAFPNPFHHHTIIRFEIVQAGDIDLKIYTMEGQIIETLCHDYLLPGTYAWSFNATAYPAGIYFYRLASGSGHILSGKLVSMQNAD